MAKAELIKIPASQMLVGLTIKLPLKWTQHPFFINRIKLKSLAQIELIRGLDLSFVYVLSGHELLPETIEEVEDASEAEDAAKPKTKGSALDSKSAAIKAMRIGQQRFLNNINESRSVFAKVGLDPEAAYRDAATLVEGLVEHLQETDTPYLTLVGSGEMEVSVTQHGISVAVLSLMIGHALDLPKSDMRDLALGSLFHDFGKLKIPENIRRKRNDLSEPERNYLKMHPNLGFDTLNACSLYPKNVLNIVLHHHEYIDGSGYPDHLTEKDIPQLTQIVSLVNDYEDLLAQFTFSPQLALGTLFKSHAKQHSQSLIGILVKVLGIFPPGTLVSLSDGSIGKVMMTTSEVKQPHVWSCNHAGGEPNLRFLLEEDVTVSSVLKLEELTEGALKTLQADSPISFYFSAMPDS
ncbi:HD-GYP domain-containing protein [Shewanella sp.]|uniref:HD-GYP domain-containing protein n=1 Tax=Shewanella sp. TaxID=50422 RepID=UPI0040545080